MSIAHESPRENPPARKEHTPAAAPALTPRLHADPVVLDLFTDPRRLGRVVGSPSTGGEPRRGVDVEGVIGIDHGALRIKPLISPGWGRAGVAYGPVQREPGLALAVFILNGHNLSQSYELHSLAKQVWRWMRGSGTQHVTRQMINWLLRHRPRESFLRKLRGWHHNSKRFRRGRPPRGKVLENLAVGWFPTTAPVNPLREGNAFIVHAAEDQDNGELWARVGDAGLPAFKSLQNVPLYYIVVLREKGAAYYASALPGARGLGGYPSMRPIAIDPFNEEPELYAGVHQSVLGEIGFGIDTRVYGVKAQKINELAPWFGSAHAADELHAGLPAEDAAAEVGGSWRITAPAGAPPLAMLDPQRPTGLVHAMIDPAAPGPVGLVWRTADAANRWAMVIEGSRCRLEIHEQGVPTILAEAPLPPLPDLKPGSPASVQILDDGRAISATINGHAVFGRWFNDSRLADATGVGVISSAPGAIRRFEAHPREVSIPAALDMGAPWSAAGDRVVVRDDFTGPAAELGGRTTSTGSKVWERTLGKGTFEITGNGTARVRADVQHPNPGRTIYTIPWDQPDFADLEVEMIPPGTARGQKHYGRSGFVFWQDRSNYTLVNLWLDDSMLTTSISSFFCVRGFEDIYEAVWTCMGETRASWGVPVRLRMIFDSQRYLFRVNDEPVLFRTMTDVYPTYRPMRITRVGLGATWEWGDDTGTAFRDFTARGRTR